MTEPGKDLARVGSYGRAPLSERQQYAVALASAGDLVPKTFWTKPANVNGQMVPPKPNPGAILYMLETAAMLGVNPMVGLTNIHIIEGKPSLSANLQAALVREAGHRLRVTVRGEGDEAVAIAQIVRSDDPEFTFEVRWGMAEARAAGVLGKDNWKKYFRSMLKARAITECIREACPEVLMGATYSPDELGANTDSQGEPIDLPQVQPDGAPMPRPEAPIVDTPPLVGAEDFDYAKAIEDATSREEALEIYRRAKHFGQLDAVISFGDVERRLGEVLLEVGQAFAEAEASAESDEDDPDVVEGEVVEDDPHESEPE